MTRLSIVLDCVDPDTQSAFWSQAMGYEQVWIFEQWRALTPAEGHGPIMAEGNEFCVVQP